MFKFYIERYYIDVYDYETVVNNKNNNLKIHTPILERILKIQPMVKILGFKFRCGEAVTVTHKDLE